MSIIEVANVRVKVIEEMSKIFYFNRNIASLNRMKRLIVSVFRRCCILSMCEVTNPGLRSQTSFYSFWNL